MKSGDEAAIDAHSSDAPNITAIDTRGLTPGAWYWATPDGAVLPFDTDRDPGDETEGA